MKQVHDDKASRHMPLKIIIAFLAATLALAAACPAQQGTGKQDGSGEGLWPVIYPPKSFNKFPQDQVIKKEFRVTTKWKTIRFEKPLQINHRGLMNLHLVVDQAPYISTTDDDPRNLDCSEAEYQMNAFSLRRRSDGALVRPEAVLVGDNGEEVKVRPDGHLYPYFDKHVMTMALRTFKDFKSSPPPFPKSIKAFTAMRIRSTTPFRVRYFWWCVTLNPYPYYDDPWYKDPGNPASQWPVVNPSANDIKFPEDQVIKKELQVTTQWQTVTFKKPLRINRRGLMGLNLVVDFETYTSTINDYPPIDPDCSGPECAIRAACLRRRSDGVIIRPEVVLVGDNGVKALVRPGGHLYPNFDLHVFTVSLYYFKDADRGAPFPKGVKEFKSMRIRGTEPFRVRYLWWRVDDFPYFDEP
jgi:hypothetical protein